MPIPADTNYDLFINGVYNGQGVSYKEWKGVATGGLREEATGNLGIDHEALRTRVTKTPYHPMLRPAPSVNAAMVTRDFEQVDGTAFRNILREYHNGLGMNRLMMHKFRCEIEKFNYGEVYNLGTPVSVKGRKRLAELTRLRDADYHVMPETLSGAYSPKRDTYKCDFNVDAIFFTDQHLNLKWLAPEPDRMNILRPNKHYMWFRRNPTKYARDMRAQEQERNKELDEKWEWQKRMYKNPKAITLRREILSIPIQR